jgi:hypothetical protein
MEVSKLIRPNEQEITPMSQVINVNVNRDYNYNYNYNSELRHSLRGVGAEGRSGSGAEKACHNPKKPLFAPFFALPTMVACLS